MKPDRQFERKVFVTFKARANAEARLRRLGRSWEQALSFSATAVLAGAIFAVQDPLIIGRYTPAVLATGSAVVALQSLVVAQSRYSQRADAMLAHFNRLQTISIRVGTLNNSQSIDPKKFAELQDEYLAEVSRSENHTHLDYLVALRQHPIPAGQADDFEPAQIEREARDASRWSVRSARARTYFPWAMPVMLIALSLLSRYAT